jgi:hypothetical protein
MTQQGEESFEAMLINYLLAVVSQAAQAKEVRRIPDFVPSRIRVSDDYRGPIAPGEYDCQTTLYGLMLVEKDDGFKTDSHQVYAHECEILAMCRNLKKQIFEREKKGNTAT